MFPAAALGYPEIVMDYGSGRVLYHEDLNQSWYPASLTKLMTLYLAFEALRTGELTLEEKLDVSAHAASQSPTRLGLRQGESISVGDAIQAIAMVSANDAAVVIAERLQGSEAEFAAQMTRQAKTLGMAASEFYNASGLPNERQRTTAADMVRLALTVIRRYPEFFHYFSERSFRYKGRARFSTNGFVAAYSGADGLKTGYTCGSGYNLIATAKRDDVRLIGVVLGAGSKAERNTRMRKLLDYGFAKVREPGAGEILDEIAGEQSAELSTPPFRLTSNRCGSASVQTARNENAFPPRTLTKGDPLPGWGILLGIQKAKNDALSILNKSRSLLEQVKISGTPALLKREFPKGSSWKVLLVGLEKAQAGRGCQHLLSKSVICVIQSPKRMNSRGYSLR
ncbi:MAG: D-alanyl-D-alanine carboxypeptidase family protein [Gammaproteobacteria bacterium]